MATSGIVNDDNVIKMAKFPLRGILNMTVNYHSVRCKYPDDTWSTFNNTRFACCDMYYISLLYILWIAFYHSYINISSQIYSVRAGFITLGSSQDHLNYIFFSSIFTTGLDVIWGAFQKVKFSPANKMHIFECRGNICCVEFQSYPLKFHTTYPTHTLKDKIIKQQWNFKSSYI